MLRTDSPPLLASGSCGATRCARFASSAQTRRRKSEVRSALRAPTPRLRCSAPQKATHAPRARGATRDLFEDFVRVLSTPDVLLLAEVYPA
ncbi:MAG: hypothetical protein LT103_11380, partial [Burkholderiaceae bacterium]|nr:hypothetical protein [Burkholderiaceae bacterium]